MYKDKDVLLFNGDCLEVMDKMIEKGMKVGCVITDPPYGMDFKSNFRKEKYDKIKNDSNLEWLQEFVNSSYELMQENTHLYCFCSFHNVDIFKQALEKKFKIKNILIWEKNNTSMGDLKGDYAPKYEMIIYCHKGRRTLNGRRDCNILKYKRTGNKNHPTEKPVDLIEFLVGKSTQGEDVIFDPFMGSGTTGIACKNLGRKFIGIELDEGYYEIAKERIKKEV